MFKYSKLEHSCYNMYLNYKNLPSDLVSITNEDHNKYWASKPPKGKVLAVGYPFEFVDIPPKSNNELLKEEMDKLNSNYDIQMLSLANEYNIAVARDASAETEKVLAARSKIDALDTKYELDQANLIAKHNEA